MTPADIDRLAEFCGIKQPGKPIEMQLLDVSYEIHDFDRETP